MESFMRDTDRKGLSLRLLLPLLGIGIIVLVISAILISRRAALAAPEQPIAFSHEVHDDAGVQCLYCHPNAMRSDIAGIPSVEKCIDCHRTIANDRDEVQVLLGFWERKEPIPWEEVVRMADHVYFSHQPHMLSGINCETCHGNVGEMTVARPVVEMDMGWCLECHYEQPEEKVARLADCLACHK
jgi:hypothetical protein